MYNANDAHQKAIGCILWILASHRIAPLLLWQAVVGTIYFFSLRTPWYWLDHRQPTIPAIVSLAFALLMPF